MLRPGRKIPRPADRRPARRPSPRSSRRHPLSPCAEPLESRRLLATFIVTNTLDNGSNANPTPGSLRAAMVASNQATPGPNSIHFDIAASTAPNLDVPVTGFDPNNQTWTITPQGALPAITTSVNIDGFTEANVGMPYAYPNEVSSGAAPTEITTVPNTTPAISGNNARVRIIIDGSQSNGATGFVLGTSYSMLRGLIIADFGVGVSVPNATDVGNSIQGDFIGDYFLHPVDPNAGTPLPAPDGEVLVTAGSAQQGVVIDGANTTLGGSNPQDDVVITDSGSQGVWLQPGSLGSQVIGCQIGVIGPSDFGVYYSVGSGAEGVLVQSSSDLIGVVGAGNEIGANAGDGVQIDAGATQVQIAANYIGVAPGGGYKFGNPPPANRGDGVNIIGAPNNTVGGSAAGAGNTISFNGADGVSISGTAATGNLVSYNYIGVTADGSQALGNADDGVVVTSSRTQIGPGNVISANQVGVDIAGATTTGITIIGDLIGTDLTGEFDLGNAFQGVLVDAASGVTIQGDAAGSQVISGNEIGIELMDSATAVLIDGTFIGTDKAGSVAMPNAHQGILIDQGAWDNTIGGTGATSKNLVSANHGGIEIDSGPPTGAASNLIEGNLVGTDLTGLLPLGNEIDGIAISDSSGNTIGGIASATGNTIAFNTDAGVHVVSGNADAIESNSIFSNGTLGIQLDGSSNDGIVAPALTAALPDTTLSSTEVDVSYTGQPNSTYLIQFFSTPGGIAQGMVEGETLIGVTTVRTDASGSIIGAVNGIFPIDVPVVVTAGDWVTATATYQASIPANPAWNGGDSSEFTSPPVEAINPFLVTSIADQASSPALGTLRYAIIFSNGHPSPSASSPNDIQFLIAGVGLQTIELQQALPAITASLVIDGYSQPGSKVNDSAQLLAPDTFDGQETDIASIQVQLDGSGILGVNPMGLDVRAPNCTIDGLSLTGFSGAAIFLEPGSSGVAGAVGDTVWGNFIGVTQFNAHTYNPVKPSTNTSANGVGILIDGPNNVVGGSSPSDRNVIEGNRGDGVILYGSQGTGNTIATDFVLDNGGDGVLVLSASNHVGQASGLGLGGAGNLISGNLGNGVHILDPMARGNTVANDEIGTQVGLAGLASSILGLQVRPNALSGVLIENAPANTVGGLVSGSANVLSGNLLDGVTIENYNSAVIPSIVSSPPSNTPYTSSTRNVVEGNLIGYNTRFAITAVLPNHEDGVNISSAGNVVGGTTSAARNQIVSNRRNGITISGIPLDASDNPDAAGLIPFPQAVADVVAGNYIGTIGGSDDYGNAFDGILVDQSGGNTLGGTVGGSGNVVSNNGAGIVIAGSLSAGNVVAGDMIGTTSDGTAPMANGTDGVAIVDAPVNVIGGTIAAAANVISGNTRGVHISGAGATGNLVEGDFIGTNNGGTTPLGNSLDGVAIDGGASTNTIGGTAAGAADVIAFNGGAGVHVFSGVGNSILSDSLSANDASGIVLVGSGNDAQAAPTITSATPLTTATLVSGTLASAPSTTFLIQLFSSTSADASGSYEGQVLVGSTTITTDATGRAGFGLALPASIPFGAAITATATDLTTGDTSAFSGSALNAPLIEFSATQYYVSQPASSAVIMVTRNTGVGSSTVVYSASPGTAVAGVDFTTVTAALTFAPGQTSASFSVPILATQGRVGDYTVDLTLSRPTGAGLGSPSSAFLTITSSPGTLQLTTSAVVVPESGGGVAITVERVRGAAGTVSVSYAAAAVNAIPGVDYVPVSGTLTFPPGVTEESFTLPILGNSPNPNDATIAVSLSGPTGGAALGSPTIETVTIDKPLVLTGERLSAGGDGIGSIVLSFNKPLDPSQASNLANFGSFVFWASPRGVFTGGGNATPLAAAVYDASSQSVTLVPAATLPLNRLYRITVDGSARPVLANGLSDAYGGLLEGSSGIPGAPYLLTFGAGKKLTYPDSRNQTVTLQLSRGGIMTLFQSPDGAVEQLGLIGTVPGRSRLTTTVQRGPGGTGRTTLPPISGAAGVRIISRARPLVAERGTAFARRAWLR